MKKLFFSLALVLSVVSAFGQAMRTFNSTNDMVSASFNPYSQNTNYFVLTTNDMSYQHWVWWLGDTSAVSTYNLQSLRPGTIGRFKLVENLHWNRAGDVNGDTYIIYNFLTNYIATNSLAGASYWTNSAGILRPIDLTLPVKITNSIILSDGGTNSIQVLSGGTTAGYTNGATDVKWNVLNGSGNGASLEAQAASGFLATAGGSTSVGLRALTHQVTLDSVLPGFRPVVDLAEDNGLMKYAWRTNLAQHVVVRGFEEGSGSPNHSILDISQADTNSPVVFDQKTAGTAGYSRGFSFRTNGVEVFNVTGTGGPSSGANWTAVGTTDSSLAGTASAVTVNAGSAVITNSLTVNGQAVWGPTDWLETTFASPESTTAYRTTSTNSTYPAFIDFASCSLPTFLGYNAGDISIGLGTPTVASMIATKGIPIINLGHNAGHGMTASYSWDVVNIGDAPGYNMAISDAANFYNIGYLSGYSMLSSGVCLDVFNLGYYSGSSSRNYNASQAVFNLGTYAGQSSTNYKSTYVMNIGGHSGSGAYQTNSFDVINLGYGAGQNAVYTNSQSIINIGNATGAASGFTNSQIAYSFGVNAGHSMYLTNSIGVMNIGHSAGNGMSLSNSFSVYNFGGEAGMQMTGRSIDNIASFGNGAFEYAKLTNTIAAVAVGYAANMNAIGDISYSMAVGPFAQCTNQWDFCFGTNKCHYFMPGEWLTVGATVQTNQGSIWIASDCSALTFTDRSSSPSTLTDAYAIVRSHQTKDGKVDHSKLSRLAWGKDKTGQPDQSSRDIGMVLSAQQMVIQDLMARIEKLEKK